MSLTKCLSMKIKASMAKHPGILGQFHEIGIESVAERARAAIGCVGRQARTVQPNLGVSSSLLAVCVLVDDFFPYSHLAFAMQPYQLQLAAA